MKRFFYYVILVISIIAFAILISIIALSALHYKKIRDGIPVARSFPGTIVDGYQGVWARNFTECNIDIDKSSRTLINTRNSNLEKHNFRFQCDLIKFPKKGDPDDAIQLGCWKVIDRSAADARSKAVYDFGIIDRNNVTIGNDLYTRCEPQ